MAMPEFSFKTRKAALERFSGEEFDFLVIGGGITGSAVARDAASRGLKVALVERMDFAFGTSSRSSKLIHGGLRYLKNFELPLVFESLSERDKLLKIVPHLVRPLPFFVPVYKNDLHGRALVSFGLWLYDILSFYKSSGFHKKLSPGELLEEAPFLRKDGLKGGFRYYEASMWDDALSVEILRSAVKFGAQAANYVEAETPLWQDGRVAGFRLKDRFSGTNGEISLYAKRVIACTGPWTDELGLKLSSTWEPWIDPSKGIHLVFDIARLPLSGAVIIAHPRDWRISFAIPRPDFGSGVVIVGTTDSPTPPDPDKAVIDKSDVDYLVDLLQRYFPQLKLDYSDIISAYVGVRPLVSTGGKKAALHKISREHYIGLGPGGVVLAAGGKYTTHRTMAGEIVDFALDVMKKDAGKGGCRLPYADKSRTDDFVNEEILPSAVEKSLERARQKGWKIPQSLIGRFGAGAVEIAEIHYEGVKKSTLKVTEDPPGFPFLEAQLRHAIRCEMVLHLEDFYLRRVPLFLSRADHGLPWAERLAMVWAEELGLGEKEAKCEAERLDGELVRRCCWRKNLV